MSGRRFLWSIASTLALGILLLYGMTAAAKPEDNEEQLRRLRARMHTLQKQLNQTRGQRDAVRDELQNIERRTGELIASLKDLTARLGEDKVRLDQLRHRAAAERQSLRTQMEGLESQARAAYALSRQGYLKLLLNQENPASVSRVVTYYQYLNQARSERIASIKVGLVKLERLEQEIEGRNRELNALHDKETAERKELEGVHARRQTLLARLNRQVNNQSEEIKRLQGDEQRLERLLREMKTHLPPTPAAPGNLGFIGAKGKLPLPATGHITARFGDQKRIGDLRWRGVFIAGAEGQPVISVFRGRVVYADWLHGFGLLLILDHGDGYMTLYGHNQALYRHVGDWIEGGQPIATVGSTGDAPGSGVYFEIRHNGKPYDPLQWCSVPGRPISRRR